MDGVCLISFSVYNWNIYNHTQVSHIKYQLWYPFNTSTRAIANLFYEEQNESDKYSFLIHLKIILTCIPSTQYKTIPYAIFTPLPCQCSVRTDRFKTPDMFEVSLSVGIEAGTRHAPIILIVYDRENQAVMEVPIAYRVEVIYDPQRWFSNVHVPHGWN